MTTEPLDLEAIEAHNEMDYELGRGSDDVPRLVAEVRRLRAEAEGLTDALLALVGHHDALAAKVEAVRALPAATLQRTSPSDRIANAWDEGAAYQRAATLRAIGDTP